MAVITITSDSFDSVTSLPGIVLLDWWASWCPPCRQFGPIFEKAADAHPDIVFGSVDTEKQSALAGRFSISAIPTIMAYRDGILVYSQPGALGGPEFERLITMVQGLDMDKVRAEAS